MRVANTVRENTIINFTISSSAVAKQLKKLKACKSPGPDNIYPCFLKELTYEITRTLITIFIKSTSESSVVDAWEAANFIPIYKRDLKAKYLVTGQ